MTEGDILGHEPMGIVEEVGSEVTQIKAGDRVVIPFNISCGNCWMCDQSLFAQCETTQNRDPDKGASLLGFSKLYGSVPGGQAEYLRVPQAQMGQANVKRWIDEIMPLLNDEGDPLGTEDLASHKIPIEGAPDAYEMFMNKEDGATKVVIEN